MDLQHTFTVPIGIDEAWTAFNDLEGIAPCFPGALITSVDGDDFTGTAKVKLGPISLTYTGKGAWVERDGSAYKAVIEAAGKDKRGNGTAAATITAHLEPVDDGTKVVVDTDLRITGRPAQFGRGVIQDVGAKILDQFATCLSERLGQSGDVTDPEAPAASAGGPVASDDGGGIAPGSSDPSRGGPTPSPSPHPAPQPASSPQPAEPAQLDLGDVVGLVLLKRYGVTAAACAATAVLTWLVARRRS